MAPAAEPPCRVIAEREPGAPVWTFHLVNDGSTPIAAAVLAEVRYEWGDRYMGGSSPGTRITDLGPGARAVIYHDDGSSEMRTDLWLCVTHQGEDIWLLFEFPKLYRQAGTKLVAVPTRVAGPPGDAG